MCGKLTKTAAIASLLALGGCQQYLARQDLIEPWSGDAVARNSALQVIDPWPRHAYDTHIPTSGHRQATAIKKYKTWGEDAPLPPMQPIQLVVPPQ